MHVLVPDGHPAWSFAAHLKRGSCTEAIVWTYGGRDVFKLVDGTLGAECVFLWLDPAQCNEKPVADQGNKTHDKKDSGGQRKKPGGKKDSNNHG